MNWGMSARPYVRPPTVSEGISDRAVSMDPKSMSSLLQGSPIINEERLSSWPLNVPTYSHNHQVDAEVRWLRCTPVILTDTDVKVSTVGVYLSPQSTIQPVDEGAWMSFPEDRGFAGVNDDDFPTACLSDPESMFPRFTTVCELTIYQSPLV